MTVRHGAAVGHAMYHARLAETHIVAIAVISTGARFRRQRGTRRRCVHVVPGCWVVRSHAGHGSAFGRRSGNKIPNEQLKFAASTTITHTCSRKLDCNCQTVALGWHGCNEMAA